MSDAVSALAGMVSSGFVRVEEAGLAGMVTIRGNLTGSAFRKAVKAETGAVVPELGQFTFVGDNTLHWMSPDELLLMCPHEAADLMVSRLDAALSEEHALAVNVSDARALFRVTGEGSAIRDALAKLTPANLRKDALAVGSVRRTRLSQVPAAIWFTGDDSAHVVCFRSVARYVFDLLRSASAPGSEVDYFR